VGPNRRLQTAGSRHAVPGLADLWVPAGDLAVSRSRSQFAAVVVGSVQARVVGHRRRARPAPSLARQEVWGLLLARLAMRGLTRDAALRAGQDPDRLSFPHAARVVRRKLPLFAAFPLGTGSPCRAGGGPRS